MYMYATMVWLMINNYVMGRSHLWPITPHTPHSVHTHTHTHTHTHARVHCIGTLVVCLACNCLSKKQVL